MFGLVVGVPTTGSSVSLTVTANVQESVPSLFVAVAVTVVEPTPKTLPDSGEYVIVGTG